MLLSLPLTSCTFSFNTVSLTNSRRLSKDTNTGEMTINQSHLYHYSNREASFAQLNLRDFFANYTVIGNKVKRRIHPVIIRTFPAYSSNPHKYGQYCRFQLLKYHPWSNTTSYSWQNEDSTDQDNVDSYTQFLTTNQGQASIPTFAEELQKAERFLAQSTENNEHENDVT